MGEKQAMGFPKTEQKRDRLHLFSMRTIGAMGNTRQRLYREPRAQRCMPQEASAESQPLEHSPTPAYRLTECHDLFASSFGFARPKRAA